VLEKRAQEDDIELGEAGALLAALVPVAGEHVDLDLG
jgi:hypothetical protein